jgi:uncharacterized protein YcfL
MRRQTVKVSQHVFCQILGTFEIMRLITDVQTTIWVRAYWFDQLGQSCSQNLLAYWRLGLQGELNGIQYSMRF